MLTGPTPTPRSSPWAGVLALGLLLAAVCFIAWLALG